MQAGILKPKDKIESVNHCMKVKIKLKVQKPRWVKLGGTRQGWIESLKIRTFNQGATVLFRWNTCGFPFSADLNTLNTLST